ncbi:glycosyltransferase family 2 protein [Orbaceae bacterium ESL0721]|nr:glycosyltransferase family 2 protein [Orbaceae bacterium ESL0721]
MSNASNNLLIENSNNVLLTKKEPLVSVLLTIYNVDKYLAECLDSILSQSYKNLEIVCVDNGSPDKCGEILKHYQKIDNRIKIVTLAENRKLCGGRNVSLDNATGDFICFVDPDDWIEKNYIQSMVDKIEQFDPDGNKYNLVINYNAINYMLDENKEKITILHDYLDGIGKSIGKSRDGSYYDYNKDPRIELDIPMWGRLYRKTFLDQYPMRFLEGLQIDNLPYTINLSIHLKHFYLLTEKNNNRYWRRMITINGALTETVLYKNYEGAQVLDSLYSYLKKHDFTNKVKVVYEPFFNTCFPYHIDKPRYYLSYKALMLKMEDDIKSNPHLYNDKDLLLCDLLIYSNGYFDFSERYIKLREKKLPDQTSTLLVKLFGILPFYKKRVTKYYIYYYLFSILIFKLKIKMRDRKYVNGYLFGVLKIFKKY